MGNIVSQAAGDVRMQRRMACWDRARRKKALSPQCLREVGYGVTKCMFRGRSSRTCDAVRRDLGCGGGGGGRNNGGRNNGGRSNTSPSRFSRFSRSNNNNNRSNNNSVNNTRGSRYTRGRATGTYVRHRA